MVIASYDFVRGKKGQVYLMADVQSPKTISRFRFNVGLIATVFLLLLPLWLLTSNDSEEHGFTTQSTVLGATSLFQESNILWNNLIGLGTPQPFATSWIYHPLLPLFYVLDYQIATLLLFLTHFFIGSWFLLLFLDELSIDAKIKGIALFSFWGSSATFNYLWSDFWPTDFWQFSLLPPLIWGLQRLIADTKPSFIIAFFVSYITVLNVLNGHLGALYAYAMAIGSGAIWAFPIRRTLTRLLPTSFFSLLFCIPKLAVLFSEQKYFPPDIEKFNHAPYPVLDQMRSSLLGPFLDTWSSEPFRLVFLGFPFLVLAVWKAVEILFRENLQLKFICTTFACAIVFSFLPTKGIFAFVSSALLFRDVIVTTGVILASYSLQALLLRSHTAAKLGASLQIAQFLQMAIFIPTIWKPFLECKFSTTAERCELRAQKQARCDNIPVILTNGDHRNASRVYFSPMAERNIPHHTYATCGIPTVNQTYFKGVSSSPLYPDYRKFYGTIRSQDSVLSDSTFFSFFGIRYLVAHESEPYPVSFQLLNTDNLPPGFVLRKNPDWSWGRVFRSDDLNLLKKQRPMRAGCEHDGTLCLETAIFMNASSPVPTKHLEVGITNFKVTDLSAGLPEDQLRNRTILFPVLFRPGWVSSLGPEFNNTEALENSLGLLSYETKSRSDLSLMVFNFRGKGNSLYVAMLISWIYLAISTLVLGYCCFRVAFADQLGKETHCNSKSK